MDTLTIDKKDTVVILTLNRPDKLNAINKAMIAELSEGLHEIRRDPLARCLVITGAGKKAFAAGADIAEMEHMDFSGAKTFAEKGCAVMQDIETLPIPVIAAVNGFALGGGMELALACDIRIAAENAVFGLPETSLGVIPGFGGTVRLSRIAGYAAAAEMIFSGKAVDAIRAQQCGIVSHVVKPEELMGYACSLAEAISRNAPLAVKAAKRSMRPAQDTAMENMLFAQLFLTKDQRTGMDHFLHKKKAEYFLGE
ncbi:enoyl-CoA hydratase/isomerase family protein [Christensenella timonensis]|uniref:enoyl-CoA hydratase/isomerase family protein n=1 Tax=Christensenella timonensis TaxID=1816678 RepID=UPI0009EE11CD|nr:enoyl-CoA hydratase-related protein [Christensenella timonensis]